jgi:hypothetical protein
MKSFVRIDLDLDARDVNKHKKRSIFSASNINKAAEHMHHQLSIIRHSHIHPH